MDDDFEQMVEHLKSIRSAAWWIVFLLFASIAGGVIWALSQSDSGLTALIM